MSQQRNSGAVLDSRAAANAIPEEQILDAAYELMLAVGMKRTTMAEIARRAGVSRATLYRRWPNVQAVVGALTTRELAAAGAKAYPSSAVSARAAVVRGIVGMVGAVRSHPLTRKIIEVDPEFLLPYLLHRRGTSTAQQLQLIENGIRAGRADGSIRGGRPATQARALWLTACSFALTAPVLADEHSSLAALDRQLGDLLDRYLAP